MHFLFIKVLEESRSTKKIQIKYLPTHCIVGLFLGVNICLPNLNSVGILYLFDFAELV